MYLTHERPNRRLVVSPTSPRICFEPLLITHSGTPLLVMTCFLCRFEAPPGAQGHPNRRCSLRQQLQCRHWVYKEHIFYLLGPCLSETCSHNKQCAVRGLVGHTSHSLTLSPTRWRLTPAGFVVHIASLGVPIITGIDFVCPLVGDCQASRIVAAVHDLALSAR